MTHLLDQLDVLEVVGDPAAVDIAQIEHDSRSVVPGALFCCLTGAHTDGHDHVPAALARGAVAVLCERLVPSAAQAGVLQVRVGPGEGRRSMARAAAAFYDHPADALTTAGVTGTNGKTTVSHLVGAVLEAAGQPTTVIGTLSGARTTPEATELQRQLAEVRDRQRADGVRRAVSMEVSSHALAQARVEGIRFDVAVFTNLGRDHLDYHGSMEAYFAAKASLFTPARAARAVIWVEDPWGARLAADTRVPTTALARRDLGEVSGGPGWSAFEWRGRPVRTRLSGTVNAVNALLAAEAARALGVEADAVVAGLGAAAPVPGRMEVVTAPPASPFTVLVDYAHTPDALEVALTDARRLLGSGGRVIVVFGAGGDRDPGKRPAMGAVAAERADLVVVTSDNPRHEDPAAIVSEITAGIGPQPGPGRLRVELERRAAIAAAIGAAHPGDVVVVAGKGHETVQQIGEVSVPFDDRAVVAELAGSR